MIYPPEYKNSILNSEEKVFKALSQLPDEDFTTFYNQQFTSVNQYEKNEYEIDFIIADHRDNRLNSIIVVEVKGGNIKYDGVNKVWLQNARAMDKSPNDQASSSMNSLVKRFRFLSVNVPFHWVLWFPDVIINDNEWLPTQISKDRLLDANSIIYSKESIPFLCDSINEKYHRDGASLLDFNKFKDLLLRSVGFFKPLHKEFEENELTFRKLTDNQAKIFKYIDVNKNICVQGPAGSGKTFIAYNKAIEYAEQGLKVIYICFNKTLATDLRYRYKNNRNISQNDFEIDFTNFHFWALRIAEQNPTYKKGKGDAEFFNTYIPNKAREVLNEPIYDVVIIDEGQDFRDNWLELVNRSLTKEGRFLFFMDENQDIFTAFKGVPNHRHLTKCELDENCRNTKEIISLLKTTLPSVKMIPMENTPLGQPVSTFEVNDNDEQLFKLNNIIENLLKDGIRPNQIIILTNNVDDSSSLKGIKTFANRKLISTYDREYGRDENCIAHTTINVFKGLESDVIFILDAQNIGDKNNLYTQASRAKHLLYIFSKNI